MASQQQNTLHSPTSLWRSWSFWLRVLGVGLIFVCGLALTILLNSSWVFLIVPLVGIVSACLLRSWWAMLIVPVVFSVGAALSAAIALGGFDKLISVDANIFFTFVGLGGIVPAVVGAVIGTPIGVFWKKRQPL